jgi:hypothetical protein
MHASCGLPLCVDLDRPRYHGSPLVNACLEGIMRFVTPLLATVFWLAACSSGSDLTEPDQGFPPSIDPNGNGPGVHLPQERVGALSPSPLFSREHVHATQIIPLEGGFSGINPCTGEETVINGEIVIRTNLSGDEGGFFHIEETTEVSGTGVGVTTGTRYTLLESFHHSFNSPSGPAPQYTITEHDVIHVNAQGAAGNYVDDALLHFSVTPTGVTVEVEKGSVTCRG